MLKRPSGRKKTGRDGGRAYLAPYCIVSVNQVVLVVALFVTLMYRCHLSIATISRGLSTHASLHPSARVPAAAQIAQSDVHSRAQIPTHRHAPHRVTEKTPGCNRQSPMCVSAANSPSEGKPNADLAGPGLPPPLWRGSVRLYTHCTRIHEILYVSNTLGTQRASKRSAHSGRDLKPAPAAAHA